MDFLEKAVGKAGQQEQPQKVVASQGGSKDSEIIYTQTRQVMPNSALLRERRVVTMQKHDPLADTFRMLRTKILKQLRSNNWNSFAITAPTRGAGKSMIAANLAISIAREVNQTVLLVDLDLRFPKLNWYFDLDIEHGLLDYLRGEIPLNEALINPGVERLVILPGHGSIKDSSELISSPKMKDLIDDVKSRYSSRIIIFDMPPVLAVDDVLAAMDYYDAVLLVVEDGVNTPDEVEKAIQMLAHTNLLGTVLNKAETLPEHQGYY